MQESSSLSQGAARPGPSEAAVLDRLAVRASAGDRPAFEEIYLLLVDELYAFVRSQCHNDDAAEDIVATVFLKAWRSARRYRPGSERFRPWIFAIARNELRNHWRETANDLAIADFDLLDENATVEAGDDRPAARAAIAQALRSLTQEQRQVVILRYFNNKSHEEIAAIMHKREGAVRALLMRALRHMRKVMSDAAP